MVAMDYYDYTSDANEFMTSILPLSTAVTDFFLSHYSIKNGSIDIWPTQSLEGYNCGFPPTR